MSKLNLPPLTAGFRSSNRLNTNFEAIEAALENTLSRDGTAPNAMAGDLDMNSHRIINLPAAVDANDAVRKADFDAYEEAAAAALAAAVVAQADADAAVVATAADVVTTNTARDAALAAQTGAETAQGLSEAARDLAEADAVATAADRVQTALDRVATAADAVATAADRVAVAADKASVSGSLARLAPFTTPPTGLELARVHSLTITSADDTALYAIPMYLRYFSRISNTLYCLVAKVSDNTVMAAVGLNGSTKSVTGLTGIQTLPLLQSSNNGVTGFVTIDFGAGEAWTPGPAAWSTAQGGLNNDKIIFANPSRTTAIETIAEGVAKDVVSGSGVFLDAATDDYARALVRGLKVEGGEGDSYFLNYETITYAGIPLTRVQFQLHSVATGDVVASRSYSNASEATLLASLPSTIKMTLAANGALLTGYGGFEATLTPDWSAIDLTKAQTTYTTTAATGIHPDAIVSNDDMDEFLQRSDPKVVTYVATGETVETVADAFLALRNNATPFSRSTYPNSDLCTFSNQHLIKTAIDHDEEITPYLVGAIWNGLLIPHYATLEIPEGAKLWMDDASTAPVLDASFSCRIRGGGEIEQLGEGYGIHIDALNTLTVKGASDFLRYRHRIVLEDITIRHHGTTSTAAMIGSGIADGSTMIFRGVRFIREGVGTAPLVIIHTSPDSVFPSTVIFEDCYFNDELIAGPPTGIRLLKSNAQTVQHKLIVRNTQTGSIVVSNSAGGSSGWVRQGAIDERISYTSMLDPS